MQTRFEVLLELIEKSFKDVSASTLSWLSIIAGHCVFIPSMLAILTAITDKTPSIDIVILVQAFLVLSFIRTVVVKDTVGTVIHALGWFTNMMLLALVLFK